MALVRCTCLVQVPRAAARPTEVVVQVLDPTCGYVVHRLAAELVAQGDTVA